MVITSTNPRNCCDLKTSLTLIRSNVVNATTDVYVPSIFWWLLSHPLTCVCPYYIQLCIALTYSIHLTSDIRRNRNNTRSWVMVRSIKSVNFSEICVPRCEIFTLFPLILFWREQRHPTVMAIPVPLWGGCHLHVPWGCRDSRSAITCTTLDLWHNLALSWAMVEQPQ